MSGYFLATLWPQSYWPQEYWPVNDESEPVSKNPVKVVSADRVMFARSSMASSFHFDAEQVRFERSLLR